MDFITTKQRQWTVAILVFSSIFVIGFSFRHILSLTQAPFERLASESGNQNLTAAEQIEAGLKAKDTDGDGLNDFDELKLYHTSPYLVDSDSDGVDDKAEIASGADPNCPGSEDCYGRVVTSEEVLESEYSSSTESLTSLLPVEPTAENIRKLLIEGGVSAEQVNELSDEEVLSIYQEAYNAL